MAVSVPACLEHTALDRLRTELADLAYDLERQGRLDAADVVMQLDARLRELAGENGLAVAGVADPGAFCGQSARGRLASTLTRPGSPTPATEI